MKKERKQKECTDPNCPNHGSLSCRGRTFKGVVISTKTHKTATIEFERRVFLEKYERFAKKMSKIKVHNPSCIDAKEGDVVIAMECRPISKTKHFAIIKKVGVEKGFSQKKEALEEGKFKKLEKEDEIDKV